MHDNQAHPIRVHVSDNFLQLQQPLKEGRGLKAAPHFYHMLPQSLPKH